MKTVTAATAVAVLVALAACGQSPSSPSNAGATSPPSIVETVVSPPPLVAAKPAETTTPERPTAPSTTAPSTTTPAPVATHAGGGHATHGGTAVEIRLLAYRPASIEVAVGDTITWTQSDPGFHTITSGIVRQLSGGIEAVKDGGFDSGNVATGATFELRLDTPGIFPYFCAIHAATMQGTITVT